MESVYVIVCYNSCDAMYPEERWEYVNNLFYTKTKEEAILFCKDFNPKSISTEIFPIPDEVEYSSEYNEWRYINQYDENCSIYLKIDEVQKWG